MLKQFCILAPFILSYFGAGFCQELPQKKERTSALSVKGSIVVDNRVLANVRNQAITIYDIVKKLDMIFYKQFPEYRSSPEARLQFYKANWKIVLKDMIHRQLALAYAEDKKFEVSRGDIREELEELFGPEVMMNLYDAGLSLYDVEEMLKADILMRRILMHFIRSPIMASLTPEKLHEEYIRYVKAKQSSTDQEEEWVWQACLLKPAIQEVKTESLTQEKVAHIHETLLVAIADDTLPQEMASKAINTYGVEIIPSQKFTSVRSEMSSQIVNAIEATDIGVFSKPVVTQSRNAESETVWKSYRLIEKKRLMPEIPNFRDIEAKIREEVAAPLMAEKTEQFFQDLKRQYGVHMAISEKELETFEPFRLTRN